MKRRINNVCDIGIKWKMGLAMDAQSLTGATRLYEKAGMRVDRRYDAHEKELRPGKDLSAQSVEG